MNKESSSGMVQRMREIREELSAEIMDMTLEEEKDYIRKQIAILKAKHKNQDREPAEAERAD